MMQSNLEKAQTKIVIGMLALTFSAAAFQWFHSDFSDFLGGVAFGAGALLVLLGLAAKRRQR